MSNQFTFTRAVICAFVIISSDFGYQKKFRQKPNYIFNYAITQDQLTSVNTPFLQEHSELPIKNPNTEISISNRKVNPYNAGIDFRRQNLTYVEIRLKIDPRTRRVKIFLMTLDP